jgi:hypothetical protein
MNCDASLTQGLTRFRSGLILAFALALGLALTSFKHTALAALDGAQVVQGQRAVALDAQTRGAFVVAKKDDDGDRNWSKNGNGNKGNKNWSKKDHNDWNGNGDRNWSKNDGDRDDNGDWNDNGDRNWVENGGDRDDNGDWNDNGNKNWSKHGNKNWGNGWSNHNNNWNNRAYVREWNRKPYYGEFIGGVILGSIFAANGVGVVPLAPQPDLCWYWADPYMYRGYWDYCY